jgi:4-oxalomesaconate tautomerase
MRLEHPTGDFEVAMEVGGTNKAPVVERVGVVRTARVLMDGVVRVPSDVARFLPI